MTDTSPMVVTVITPQGFHATVEATAVQVKTVYGNMEILRNHAPLMALLKPGKVKIQAIGKKKASEFIYIDGSGVIEVYQNVVYILADNGFYGKDLDGIELQKTETELRKIIKANTAEKINDTLDALNEVTEKLKIVEEIKHESTRTHL